MKKVLPGFRIVALVSCLCAGAQGATVATTLTVNGTGTSSGGNISATGPVTLSGIGTGTLSSNFSLVSAALSGSAPLTLTITSGAPTGTLTATITGSITLLAQVFAGTPSSGPATITVTSGTGGFAGTTGTFNVIATGTGTGTTGSGGGTFSLVGPGSLIIPGGGGGTGAPTVSQIQNNYSYILPGLPNYGIAPGSLFIVKGSSLATNTTPVLQSSAAPGIPTTLNGTSLSVTVGGTTTIPGIYYTSTGQIAAVLPSNTPTGTGTLTVTTNGQAGTPVPIVVVPSAFGIDTYYGTGTGLAVATDNLGNVFQNNNSASPGQTIVLWGSGVGADTSNTDKVFPLNQNNLTNIPLQVYIGGIAASVLYRGRSQYPGVDQVVVTIPNNVTPGCAVSVIAISGNVPSNSATLPVAPGGGNCSDPNSAISSTLLQSLSGKAKVSFGTVGITQSNSRSSTGTTTTNIALASFFSFPTSTFLANASNGSTPSFGSCVIPPSSAGGVLPTGLDAGTLTVSGGGTQATLQGLPTQLGSSFAQLGSIPASGASYNFNGSGGRDVGSFSTALNFPAPLVWTNQAAVTTVNRSQGQTVTRNGGQPGTVVSITGTSTLATTTPQISVSFTCYAPQSAGQFVIPSWVLLGLPPSTAGSLAIANITNPQSFTASGLDFAYTSGSVINDSTVAYQ